MASFNDAIIAEFRANGGRVAMFDGADLLLLTTTGAKTGRPRTSPVGYTRDGARLVVFGSNNGDDRHPDWFHNLRAEPNVTVDTGTETYPAYAVVLHDEERDRLFAAEGPAMAGYQKKTSRVIPVIALYPSQGAQARAVALGDHLVKVHDYFRQQFAAARAGRATDPDLRVHCLTMCAALHEHHTREDGFFPNVEALVPGLAPVLDRLREEHAVVAGTIRRFRELLTREPGADATPEDIEAQLDRLVADLEAHFEYEERMLIPVLNMSAS